MCPDPNWDERYEAIIVQTPWGLSEFLHVTPLGKSFYRIEKQPLDTPGLFVGDVVEAVKRDHGLPEVVGTREQSGYEAHLIKGLKRNKQGREVFNRLNKFGLCEPLASGEFSMSAPKENWPAIRALLDASGVKVSEYWWERVEDFKAYNYD
jgi:hypothetical protein